MTAPRPKVLWVTKGLARGGMEVLLSELAATPLNGRYELHVAHAIGSLDSMVEEMRGAGVQVHNLMGRSSADPRWVVRLHQLLHRENFAIVHPHSPLPASVVRLRRALTGGRERLVSTEHSSRIGYRVPTRWLNDLTSLLDEHRIFVSQNSADSAVLRRFTSSEVLYHGRAPADAAKGVTRERVRARLGLDMSVPVIGTVANLRAVKNLPLLVEAFALVHRDIPKAKLVIVGGGPERDRIEDKISELGLTSSVVMWGNDPQGAALMVGFDIFACSSHVEGLPVAMMEAVQAGLPIVSTDVGGVPEIVAHGRNGIVTSPGSAIELAAALTALLDSPELLARMGTESKAMSLRFDVRVTARRLVEVYDQLVQCGAQGAHADG